MERSSQFYEHGWSDGCNPVKCRTTQARQKLQRPRLSWIIVITKTLLMPRISSCLLHHIQSAPGGWRMFQHLNARLKLLKRQSWVNVNDIWGDSSYWCKKKKEGRGRNCLFVRNLLLYSRSLRFPCFLLLQTLQGWPASLTQGLSEFDWLISLEQKQVLVLRAQKQGRGGANISLASCLTGTT